MSQHERICPQCGHPGLEQPPCVMCGWLPAPPPAETHLLAGEQVVTVRWVEVDGVRVGMAMTAQPLAVWLRSRGA